MWIVVANTSSCKIFDYEKKSKQLNLIKELLHPESKMKGSDLITEGPGHYKTDGPSRGAYDFHEKPQEVEFENFAREVATLLDNERRSNHLPPFILVSPPKMDGLLKRSMNPHVMNSLKDTIQKDYGYLTNSELMKTLQDELKNHH